jgi:hypothetical protein
MGLSFPVKSDRPAMSGKIAFGNIDIFLSKYFGCSSQMFQLYDNV